MIRKFYWGGSSLLIGLWLWSSLTGWEPLAPSKKRLPDEVRASAGGVRGFHFWHSGYHGGK
jgi:hypothetical protein